MHSLYIKQQQDLDHILFVNERVWLKNNNSEMALLATDFKAIDYCSFPFHEKWDSLIDKLEECGYNFYFFSYDKSRHDKKLQSSNNYIYNFHIVGDSAIWITWDLKNKKRKI
jgi:hypothetical protein